MYYSPILYGHLFKGHQLRQTDRQTDNHSTLNCQTGGKEYKFNL